ncbi:hypothetical protein BJV82DRAFT_674832 [Fennellomyces sp. T-0311]|nr:hypothetical protein BJV82DRAFT_674832 [Fennellomyces sp. T-0311]
MTVVHLKGIMRRPIDQDVLLNRLNDLEQIINHNHKRTKRALKELRASIRGESTQGNQESSMEEEVSGGRKRKRYAIRRAYKAPTKAAVDPSSDSSSSSSDDEQVNSSGSSSSSEEEEGVASDDMLIDVVGTSSSSNSEKEDASVVPITKGTRGRLPRDKSKATPADRTLPPRRGRPPAKKTVADTNAGNNPVNKRRRASPDTRTMRPTRGRQPTAFIRDHYSSEEDSPPEKPTMASQQSGSQEKRPTKRPVVIPASPAPKPIYTLSRDIESVQEVWKEWRKGLSHRLPAVEKLENEHGASWRKHDTDFYLNERQPIITEVIKRMSDHGESGETASERLEIYRIRNGISTLGELAKRIRVHRRMDEERGLVPPTLFN